MSELIRKSSTCVALKVVDDTKGIVELFPSVFGVKDSHGEIMRLGCYSDSIREKSPIGCWMHKWDEPIAKTLEVRELSAGDPMLPEAIREYGGLYVKAQFLLSIQKGREAFELIKEGVVTEYSVGYFELGHDMDGDEYHVTKVDLVEWSPVLRGSNPLTQTLSAKDAPGATLADQLASAHGAVRAVATRLTELKATRESEGKKVSADRLKDLAEIREVLNEILEGHDLTPSDPVPDAEPIDEKAIRDAAALALAQAALLN
jgi:HK97 family phage prohead protease